MMEYYNNLPPYVRQYGLACGWGYHPRPGSDKPAKIPIDLRTGCPADTTNPETFVPLSQLADFDYKEYGYDGIGLGIFGNFGAIDIDHCIDEQGNYSPMACDIISTMNSYTEISPSGRGIRILFLASNFPYDKSKYYINNHKINLEVYIAGCTNKYVSLTGNVVLRQDLAESGDLLQIVLDKYMQKAPQNNAPTQVPAQASAMDDKTLIEKACNANNGAKFSALFSGDKSEYSGDDSAADMAFANMLAFWTGCNPEQMDRIFRLSGLMRDKWDSPRGESTYGKDTIARAIADTKQVYTPKNVNIPTAITAPTMADPTTAVNVVPPSLISATDLYNISLPSVQYIVDDLLAAGTSIMAAAPKLGKSWMALHLGLCVAAGTPFMGYPTKQCGVLYLALEDSMNRLQDRMRKVLDGAMPPENFFFVNEAPTMDNGLLNSFDIFLGQHPEVRLIIIDTLQYIRGNAHPRETLYAQDYREMKTLKSYMAKKGVSALLIHHTRKQADDDVYAMISGSQGILGAADGAWMITKKKRNSEIATLHITGRDVQQNSLAITFNLNNCHWEMYGTEEEVAEKDARAAYYSSPIVKTIKKLLFDSPDGKWSGSASELIAKAKDQGIEMDATPQVVGIFLRKNSELLEELDNIEYHTTKVNGTGAYKHHFKFGIAPDDTQPDNDDMADDALDELLPFPVDNDSLNMEGPLGPSEGERYE